MGGAGPEDGRETGGEGDGVSEGVRAGVRATGRGSLFVDPIKSFAVGWQAICVDEDSVGTWDCLARLTDGAR